MATTEQNVRQRSTKSPEEDKTADNDPAQNAPAAAPPQQPQQMTYRSTSEYNAAVQQWVWQWQMWTNMMWFNMSFPLYAMGGGMPGMPGAPMPGMGPMPGMMPPPGVTQPTAVPNANPLLAQPQVAAAAAPQRGQEFKIPQLWKRVLAEFVDFILLFLIKLGVTLLTVEYVGGIDIERYDIELLFSQNIDYETAYALTSELVAMEIINRIIICIFETLCLRRGVAGTVGGTTPGKRLMGLRVISCEDIISIDEHKVRVNPAGNIGLWNALVRSVIKNFSLAFFFPVCFTVYFFQHNRAAYDVISSCVVVEAPHEEIFVW